MEVGNLANATEDRSHFGAWVIMSSPLILSFNLSDPVRVARAWPFITNRALLAINQRWAGSPGKRLALTSSWQAWTKPLGKSSHALLLIGTGSELVTASMPLRNITSDLDPTIVAKVCVRDVYTGQELPPLPVSASLVARLPVHDSAFYCLRPSGADGGCEDLGGCPSGA